MDKRQQGGQSYHSGHLAEKMARTFLMLKGYQLIAQNVKGGRGTGASEIDLIMQKNDTLIFIEVKKRKSTDDGAYAITPAMQKRIAYAAEIFLGQHPEFQNMNCRFDAVLIAPFKLPHHITDAWRLS